MSSHRYVQGVRGFHAKLANPHPGGPPENRAAQIRRDAQLDTKGVRAAGLPAPTAFAFPYRQQSDASVAELRSTTRSASTRDRDARGFPDPSPGCNVRAAPKFCSGSTRSDSHHPSYGHPAAVMCNSSRFLHLTHHRPLRCFRAQSAEYPRHWRCRRLSLALSGVCSYDIVPSIS